jgi:hypothetical protein
MKWYSPIFIIPISLVIVLLVGWSFYEYKNLPFPKLTPQAVNPIMPTHSSLSVPIYSASPPTSTPAVNNLSQLEEEWATYRDAQYKIEIHYPQEGWFLTSKVGQPVLPYPTLKEPINLYTARVVPSQGPISAPITIAVYDKPSTQTITQWLSEAYGTDLLKLPRGKIYAALMKARAVNEGERGILTYNESRKGGVVTYEVGGTDAVGSALTYAMFFVKESLPYVCEVSFALPYYGDIFQAKPSDNEYIAQFEQMVSGFHFTD